MFARLDREVGLGFEYIKNFDALPRVRVVLEGVVK